MISCISGLKTRASKPGLISVFSPRLSASARGVTCQAPNTQCNSEGRCVTPGATTCSSHVNCCPDDSDHNQTCGPTGAKEYCDIPAGQIQGVYAHNDEMALGRTRMASERTLMAWIRTALSMIAFGFTLYKFLQAIQAQSTVPVVLPNAPRNVGLVLVGIGTFAVIVACVQHWKYMKTLHPDQPCRPWDLASIVAILIGLLGILIFASIIRTAGPFG